MRPSFIYSFCMLRTRRGTHSDTMRSFDEILALFTRLPHRVGEERLYLIADQLHEIGFEVRF